MFFHGLGAVPYLLHPESISQQARCCGAVLPGEDHSKGEDMKGAWGLTFWTAKDMSEVVQPLFL